MEFQNQNQTVAERLKKLNEKVNDSIDTDYEDTDGERNDAVNSLLSQLRNSEEHVEIKESDTLDIDDDFGNMIIGEQSEEEAEEEKESLVQKPNNSATKNGIPLPSSKEDFEKGRNLGGESAALWVLTVDMATATLCSVISGHEDKNRYRMSKDDYNKYKEVSKAYFETVQVKLDPTTLFFVISVLFVGGGFLKSFGDLKERKKIEKEKAEARKLLEKREAEQKRIDAEVKRKMGNFDFVKEEENDGRIFVSPTFEAEEKRTTQEVKESKKPTKVVKRKNYKVDGNGYYLQTEQGVYIKQSDRVEKATGDVLVMIERGLTNKQIIAALKKS